jgi:regulator of replication initiation timing
MNENYIRFLEETVEHTAQMMSRMCNELRKVRYENEFLRGNNVVMKERIEELEKKLKRTEEGSQK